MVLVGVNVGDFGATESGHVHRLGGVQSVCVHHELYLLQGDGGELSLVPQAVVIRSLEACQSLDRTAARLVSQRSEVQFLPGTASPA